MKVSQIVISLSMLSVSMAGAANEWQFEFSAAVFASQSLWTKQDINYGLLPAIKADYGRWTLGGEGALLRYKLMHHDASLQVTPGIGYRDEGYGQSFGLNRRKSSALVFDGYKAPEEELVALLDVSYQFIVLQVSQDISGASKGTSLFAAAFYPLHEDKNSQLYLSAGAVWKSARYANALYGITGQNVDESKGRFAYQLNHTVNPFVSLDFFYSLTKHWKLYVGISYEQLDRAIKNSPLVDKNGLSSGHLTSTYQF